jgi:hypothetical protein
LTQNITLTAELPVVQTNITINGNGNTLSGANTFRGFFVANFNNGSTLRPLTVSIENISRSLDGVTGFALHDQPRRRPADILLGVDSATQNSATVAHTQNVSINNPPLANGAAQGPAGSAGGAGGKQRSMIGSTEEFGREYADA